MESFLAGLTHPLTGWDHVVTMVAVGLWAVQLGGRAIWALPSTFMGSMMAGGALGFGGVALPFVELGILASAIALATMVALRVRPTLPVALAIVGFFALFHGHAHAVEMSPEMSASAFAAGFVLATGMLHITGVAVALAAMRASGRHVPNRRAEP
jgi:urease accessory protein